nr:hypothetical protein GCM10017611_21880 [Rhodococcus wratislaviensis]
MKLWRVGAREAYIVPTPFSRSPIAKLRRRPAAGRCHSRPETQWHAIGMCGRSASTGSRKTLLEPFEIDPERADPEMATDCNVAPHEDLPDPDRDDEQPKGSYATSHGDFYRTSKSTRGQRLDSGNWRGGEATGYGLHVAAVC